MTRETSRHTARVQTYFDERVADYDAFYDPPSAVARQFNRVFRKAVFMRRDQVAELARRFNCRTVLDVGCGSGRNSVWFARNGIEHVVGIDISKEMIEEAEVLSRQAGVETRCEFRQMDFMNMPAGSRFDMVVALGVFDYVERAEDFLRHMSKFADRVVYGSFPGWTLVRSPLRKIRYALRGCPTHFYRRAELRALFDGVGFGPAEFKPVPSGCLAWAARTDPLA
jgi:ubiquinone/menaquinone biosynthesis C-methylase UbiE